MEAYERDRWDCIQELQMKISVIAVNRYRYVYDYVGVNKLT
jgi:hypothetical protein